MSRATIEIPEKFEDFDKLESRIIGILEGDFKMPSVEFGQGFKRIHDDNDGLHTGLSLDIDMDGNIKVDVDAEYMSARYRTYGGGGRSLRTRNALMLLALAMEKDSENADVQPDLIPRTDDENLLMEKDIIDVLEENFWLPSINAEYRYRAKSDEGDVNADFVNVYFDEMGDSYISTNKNPRHEVVFVFKKDGKNHRTWNALNILALAMKLDEEKDPQNE